MKFPGHNIKGSLLPLLSAMILAVSAGCTRREAKISFAFADSSSDAVKIEYYAATRSKGAVQSAVCPLQGGKGEMRLPMDLPAIVFISRERFPDVVPVYLEKGDEAAVTGNFNDIASWQADGNDVNREISGWRKENAAALKAGFGKSLNKRVAEYVSRFPDRISAGVILTVYFDRGEDPAGFTRLWSRLGKDVRESGIAEATGAVDKFADPYRLAGRIAPAKFGYRGDSTVLIDPHDSRLNIYWFRQQEMPGNTLPALGAIADSVKGVRLISVNLRADTTGWRALNPSCAIAVWAPGGEKNASVTQFRLPVADFIVLTDSLGTQLYRGTSASDLAARIRKLH